MTTNHFWPLLILSQIEFVQNKERKEPYPPSQNVSWTVHTTGLKPEHAISLIPGSGCIDGINGDHVCLAPAYNTTRAEIELIVDRVTRVVQDALGQ